jgi:hypothetical protein
MKKSLLYLLSLSFLSIILLGCQSSNSAHIPEENISKVSISKSDDFGKVNADSFTVFKDKETLTLFMNTLSTAVKRDGIANMAEPEFDLKVVFTNGKKQRYHLWIGEKGQQSTLMNVKDTHTTYVISEELTDWFINFQE